jgi:hypothetical protein
MLTRCGTKSAANKSIQSNLHFQPQWELIVLTNQSSHGEQQNETLPKNCQEKLSFCALKTPTIKGWKSVNAKTVKRSEDVSDGIFCVGATRRDFLSFQ